MSISISANPNVLIEEEETELTITLTSSEPIPEQGLLINIDSDVENALGQFNLLTTQFENLQIVNVNDDISGFTVLLSQQTGTINTPVFDDNDADSPQNIIFNVEPGTGYTVDENASFVTVTIEDTDNETTPTPDPDEEKPTIDLQAVAFPVEEITIAEINQAFDQGILTSEELVKNYLTRIEIFDRQNPNINSIITINPEALTTAIALDEERQLSGARSPLHGIPIVLKDNFDTFDLSTSAGALVLENSIPPDDAFVVEELREAGAIILGKTNLDELARGAQGLSSVGGQTLNPYALDRVPGGSSAGTAAAIASNFVTVGLGTETGVSIRNPAANNNLVGIVPTEGLVSRDGTVPISFTQDRVGPLARTVTDAAIVLDIIAGFDDNDPVTENSIGKIPEAGYTSLLNTTALEGARIGVFRDLFREGSIHEESLAIIETAIDDFEAEGATIIDDVSLGFDLFDFLSDARVNIFESKFALNNYLERLGPNAPVQTLQDIIDDGRYLPELGNNLIFSQSIEFSEDNPDYLERLSRREFLQDLTIDVMEELDLDALIYPMKTVPAPLIGETPPESDNSFTAIAGLPGIVVPAGFTSDGLPVGLEISGLPFSEASLLGFAYDYEQATQHRDSPVSVSLVNSEVNVALGAFPTEVTEGEVLTLFFEIDNLPSEGLFVYVDSEIPQSFSQFDLNQAVINGGDSLIINPDLSGFAVKLLTNDASISIPVIVDNIQEEPISITYEIKNRDEISLEDLAAIETVDQISDYTINPLMIGETVTIFDGDSNGVTLIGTDASETLEATANDDRVVGGLGDDTLFGNSGDDVLRGDLNSRDPGGTVGGDDVISGGNGNDQIGGKGGNDFMSGDAGDDLIWGDDGDDTIMGVTGNDTLTGDDFSGGSGSDIFIFGNGDGTDTITDFDPTEDLIGLVEGELSFADIEIITIDGDVAINVVSTDETLAILDGVAPSEITESLFVITPNVSFV